MPALTLPKFGTAKSRLPSQSIHPQVAERLEALDVDNEAADASQAAAYDVAQDARAAVGVTEGNLARAKQHPNPDQNMIAGLETELALAKRKAKSMAERAGILSRAANDSLRVYNRASRYAKAHSHFELAKLPKKPGRDIATIDAEIKSVEDCLQPFEDALASAIAQVDAEAAGDVMVHLDHNGRPDVSWPIRAVKAEPLNGASQDTIPAVFHPLPWIIRDHRDEIIATLKAKLEKLYDGRLALSAEDKRKRLDALKAEKLDAERFVCAAIWDDYKAGGSLAFPADSDPRAVLGIEGPEPAKERN